jgi:hypothetical protein
LLQATLAENKRFHGFEMEAVRATMQFEIKSNAMSYGADITGRAAAVLRQPRTGVIAFVGSAAKPVFPQHWRPFHNASRE